MSSPGTPYFDHEKLDVYGAALDFVSLSHALGGSLPRGSMGLGDQLGRAATSIALNIAEGSGEYSRREKARFYRMALRSAAECSAIMDIASRQRLADEARVAEAKGLLGRIAAMLTMLIRRHESA